jgi:hypothetical protein
VELKRLLEVSVVEKLTKDEQDRRASPFMESVVCVPELVRSEEARSRGFPKKQFIDFFESC